MSDLSGFSMFDLFRTEVQTHAAVLSDGLVTLESSAADAETIEPLMRAAHSIKGAARIVGLDDVVSLAHAMEDMLVEAQRTGEVPGADETDALLAGTDVFMKIAECNESEAHTWIADEKEMITALIERLGGAVLESEVPISQPWEEPAEDRPGKENPGESSSETTVADVNPLESRVESSAQTPGIDRMVKVDTTRLDRMLQLAGESMLESRGHSSLRTGLLNLRHVLDELAESISSVHSPENRQNVSGPATRVLNLIRSSRADLAQHGQGLETMLRRTEEISTSLYHEVLASRMRPFEEGVVAFPRLVRDLARSLDKKAQLELDGIDVRVDRDILMKLEAPLNHMIRNCLDHGIETPRERREMGKPEVAKIKIAANHRAGTLRIVVTDDGRGIDVESIRKKVIDQGLTTADVASQMSDSEVRDFLFLPGFSTASQVTEFSGRGVGLDVVRSMVEEVGGTLELQSTLGSGTKFLMQLPVTLSVMRAAVVVVDGEPYALPLARLERVVRLVTKDVHEEDSGHYALVEGHKVRLVSAVELFELGSYVGETEEVSVVIVSRGENWYGLIIDDFLGEEDLVVRPLDDRFGDVQHVLATALMESGDPLLIVDVDEVVSSMGTVAVRDGQRTDSTARGSRKGGPKILVVDDSITVLEVERQLLVRAGFDVKTASDGVDGLTALRAGDFDLLISDVDMPRMNGLDLVRAIREDRRYVSLPIMLVSYKDSEADRQAGLDAGANAYLSKGSFHDHSFLETAARLIAECHG